MTAHAAYTELFAEIAASLQAEGNPGEVAVYIPEPQSVNPDKLGIHLTTVGNEHYSYGDADERFSIQSIAKVLSLTLALKLLGREVWQRMGVEPSGTSFNSLVQLEYERGRPRNPFINAGAIIICDLLVTHLKDPKRELLDFVRQLSGAGDIDFSPRIAQSERQSGYKNYALANLMKSFGNLHNDIDAVLDVYFNLCSIEMSCRELSQTFLFLAANGVNPTTGEPVVSPRRAKRINAIMLLCGFYDEAGEFAFRVGLPGKSGVGGGIIAIHPGEYSIAVWSPRLNAKGNSHRGMQVLEALTTRTRSSIFG